jgi:pimeloyl-ACP methyl ester carboxylesterase
MIPALPPRPADVVGDLPATFRDSQVESVCWFDGSWLVSTDAWADRRLGRLDGTWRPFDAPAGWTRTPMVAGDGTLAVLVHERNADAGSVHARTDGRWTEIAKDVGVGSVTDWDGTRLACRDDHGHATALGRDGEFLGVQNDAIGTVIGLPPGVTVTQLVPSPDRSAAAVVVRRGAAYQTRVFCLRTGRSLSPAPFREPVHGTPVWLGAEKLALVVERWPGLEPVVWDWRRDEREHPWPRGLPGAVRSMAVAPDGTCAAAVSTPWSSRRLYELDDLAAAGQGQDREVRTVVAAHDGQRMPCLVYEPATALRGTVFYFPGGPHEPMWAEHSAFSRAMNDDGWRVVRVNVRSSGLREQRFRPSGPVRYGIDDVRDALALIDELGEGPVVTMGMSYGGYLAALAGQQSNRCRAVVVLSGFLSRRDLDHSRHPDVQRFAREAFATVPPEPAAFTKPVFVAHGALDPRVPLDAVLAHRTATFTVVELAGTGHAILSDHDARRTYPTLLTWLGDQS